MQRWCSYCQSFIGEIEPFQDYSLTHGICESCKGKGIHKDDQAVKNLQPLVKFFEKLRSFESGTIDRSPNEIVDEAFALKISLKDFFLGMIQPIQYEIGVKTTKGEVTIAQEHYFTSFCEQLLFLADQRWPEQIKATTTKANVLLMSTEGNYHSVGVRLLALQLKKMGVGAHVVFPGMPVATALDLVSQMQPKVVGLSVSLESQIPRAKELIEGIRKTYPDMKIVLGGSSAQARDSLRSLVDGVQVSAEEIVQLLG